MRDAREFRDACLAALDVQVFRLESEEAKILAIQAVMRSLRALYLKDGEEAVLKLVRYPRRIEPPLFEKNIELF